MAGKFESQFKHRDESILKIAQVRDRSMMRKPMFIAKIARAWIRFTVALAEAITIDASSRDRGFDVLKVESGNRCR